MIRALRLSEFADKRCEVLNLTQALTNDVTLDPSVSSPALGFSLSSVTPPLQLERDRASTMFECHLKKVYSEERNQLKGL